MNQEQLVQYIVGHHDSVYLLPLARQYPVAEWNAAMREAWRRMGLTQSVRRIHAANCAGTLCCG